jgi:hypothetical protein
MAMLDPRCRARETPDRCPAPETGLAGVAIGRDIAQPPGLIVNEVVSNAMKHALAGRPDGRVRARLSRLDQVHAELTISGNGAGFTPSCSSSAMTIPIRAMAARTSRSAFRRGP